MNLSLEIKKSYYSNAFREKVPCNWDAVISLYLDEEQPGELAKNEFNYV